MADSGATVGKGRLKKVTGSLIGDRRLKRGGEADQARATSNAKVEKVIDLLRRRRVR